MGHIIQPLVPKFPGHSWLCRATRDLEILALVAGLCGPWFLRDHVFIIHQNRSTFHYQHQKGIHWFMSFITLFFQCSFQIMGKSLLHCLSKRERITEWCLTRTKVTSIRWKSMEIFCCYDWKSAKVHQQLRIAIALTSMRVHKKAPGLKRTTLSRLSLKQSLANHKDEPGGKF